MERFLDAASNLLKLACFLSALFLVYWISDKQRQQWETTEAIHAIVKQLAERRTP